jgi:hypothetical protein
MEGRGYKWMRIKKIVNGGRERKAKSERKRQGKTGRMRCLGCLSGFER